MKSFAQSAIRLGLFVSLALLLIALAGCRTRVQAPPPAKAPNLKFVACSDKVSVTVNPNTGTDYEDEVVFVCAGKRVEWKTQDLSSFSLDFKLESPVPESTSKHLDSTGGVIAVPQVVTLPTGHRSKAFPYTLHVGGHDFDPYVIIMGQ